MEYSSVNNYGTIINISGGSKDSFEKALAASRTPSTKNANIKAKDRSKMRKLRLQRSQAIEKTRQLALKREKAEKKKKKQQHQTAVKKQQHQPSVQKQQQEQTQLPTVDGSPLPNQPPACRLTGRPMCRHPNCTKAGVPRLGPGQLLVLSGKSDYKKISEPMDIDEEVLRSLKLD